MKMILPLLLPLVLFFGGCKKKESVDGGKSKEEITAPEPKSEEAKVNAPTDSLADNIVGKVIEIKDRDEKGQLMLKKNGVILMGIDYALEDTGLTYKVDDNRVLVFKDGERDGEISFPSSSPKTGDLIEIGPHGDKRKVSIIKIESADPVRQKRAAARAVKAGKTKNFNLIRQLYISLYTQFGKDGKLPDGPLEKIIIAEVGTDELTRMKNPETGETRQVLYNLLTDFNPKQIILASPWVYGNQRWVIYGDGSGEQIDEERYQQEIQKDEVEMRPLK